MKKYLKRLLVCLLALSFLLPIGGNTDVARASNKPIAPKYIFLFIGDGMSYPQFQAASDYLGAVNNSGVIASEPLSFMKFPVSGTVQTFDSTSFCPDSASTATSLATGNKTNSGTINMDTTMTEAYVTIAEKLKQQLGYKIGILSTVNLNHATPAAFYAHQTSRNNYYEIGLELVQSGFDYFAGGALINPTGKAKDQKDLYQIAQESGYKVVRTQSDAKELTAKDGKAIVIAETLADSDAMPYAIDAAPEEWQLADYVSKGIEVLNNKKGFFMMVEGGKIDWAGHANDAASVINDTIAMSKAVDKAIAFYRKHPKETLILVTGDHETGGFSIGYAGTGYNTYLSNISKQKISYAKFDTQYVTAYKKEQTDFMTVLKDIENNFGLVSSLNKTAATPASLILTDSEYLQLQEAYALTLKENKTLSAEDAIKYGGYEPLTVTTTHILARKSGLDFASFSHTGLPEAIFAIGNGADAFKGYYDNTQVYTKLAKLTAIK